MKAIIILLAALAVLPSRVFANDINDRDLATMDIATLIADTERLPEYADAINFKMKPFDVSEISNAASWMSNFEVVIWINKANKGPRKQTLIMYQNGREILKTKVSTGREKWEQARDFFWQHRPKKTYFSSTNIGYYTPIWLNADHKSDLWGTRMPYSVFFDAGIAIHQAPPKSEWALGSRASGGCVRVSKNVAPFIFDTVKTAGEGSIPAFKRSGEAVLDEAGRLKMRTGFRTLIIVEERED